MKAEVARIPADRLGMAHLCCEVNIAVYRERRDFYAALGIDVDRRIHRLRLRKRVIEGDPRYRDDAEPYGA
jgi:hypothetical protein